MLLGIPVKEVKKFQMDMLNYFATVHPEISEEIEQTKALSDELAAKDCGNSEGIQRQQVLIWQISEKYRLESTASKIR